VGIWRAGSGGRYDGAVGLAPGDIVDGKLRLDRKLGSGTFGSVWAAEHIHMGTRVAVKILNRELAQRPEIARRFVNEARTAARVTGPHMVTIFDCDVNEDGRPFIVMELLHGENLGERVERLGPLPLVEVADIFGQMCEALTTAHALQVVHRDIKPANVFLLATHEGLLVKLLDFGIAKHLDELGLGMTRPDALLGTPAYMSPEQLRDPRTIDHRADLWSAAAVAYECLLARLPFAGKSILALQEAIAQGALMPPHHLRSELPAAVDDWFAKALAPPIDARFQTARALGETFLGMVPEARPFAGTAGRNLAINPTAPQPIATGKQGTELMVAVSDLGSTVDMGPPPTGSEPETVPRRVSGLNTTVKDPALQREDPAPPPERIAELGGTVKDPSLQQDSSPSAPPPDPGVGSTVYDPSLSAIDPAEAPPIQPAPPWDGAANPSLAADPSQGAIAPSGAPPAQPAGPGYSHRPSPSTAPSALPDPLPPASPAGPTSRDDYPIESVTASAIPTTRPVAFIAIVVALALAALVAAAWALLFRG